jgi:hypothetical protein
LPPSNHDPDALGYPWVASNVENTLDKEDAYHTESTSDDVTPSDMDNVFDTENLSSNETASDSGNASDTEIDRITGHETDVAIEEVTTALTEGSKCTESGLDCY